MKKTVTIILMVLSATMVGAQDLTHYKRVIKELSSARYQGRGYAKDGANKAGRFLQREFEKAGVDEVTLQPFKLDINTFCGKMQMWAEKVVDKPIIWVTPEAIKGVQRVKVNVDNKFLKDYECFNVIAKVAGQRHDSCYVFTAHYDHLGNLGKKVFYAGANDNASGTAAIVTLAAYYAKHRPPYDMYFIAFSGEDANLRGSNYYVEHPIEPLSQIKYLFNIDMIGDNNPVQYCEVSDEGMRGYNLFEKINAEQHHFEALHRGDLAANSDHYPFATRHVPCIFLENEKGDAFQYYHTIFDTYKTVRFDSYEPVFRSGTRLRRAILI